MGRYRDSRDAPQQRHSRRARDVREWDNAHTYLPDDATGYRDLDNDGDAGNGAYDDDSAYDEDTNERAGDFTSANDSDDDGYGQSDDDPEDDPDAYPVPDQRALARRPDHEEPAPYETPYETPVGAPMLIPGAGVSMGVPFVKRRARPLTMRITTVTLIVAVLVSGLLSVTPLGVSAQPNVSSFEALSGAVVLSSDKTNYVWYTAHLNDTIEQVANRFHVQVGGILEMNGLCPSQGLEIGKSYKIPTNQQYGANYASQIPRACASLGANAGYGYYGQTVFGTSWWNSYAGIPTQEGRCSSSYGPSYLDFKFISPNWNSSWVRGFTFYHDGVDISAPQGNPVHAVQDGQIIWAGYDATNGFGWSVVINHCDHISSLYGHMMGLAPGIKAGVNVSQGQVLGYEGMTGWATGPHVHLSIDVDNVPVNPMLFYRSVYDLTHDVPNP